MGKGRLTTSSSAFQLKTYSYAMSAATAAPQESQDQVQAGQLVRVAPEPGPEFHKLTIPDGKKFCGFLVVNCKDLPDPRLGSWIVAIEKPLPPGVGDKDYVDFEYTSWLTGKITGKATDPCVKPKIEVVFDKAAAAKKPAAKKKPAKKKSAKVAKKKKR